MRRLLGALLALSLLPVACSGPDAPARDGDPTPRSGGRDVDAEGVWAFESGEGPSGEIEPSPRSPITMEIDAAKVRGSAGCNSYGGSVSIDGESFEAGGLALTEIACPPELAEAEERFVEAIGAVDTISIDGERLTLTGPDTALVFRLVPPIDPKPLTGTVWILDSLVEGAASSSPVASAEPARLLLKPGGTFEGTTGCRSFSGTWTTSGDVVAVTQMVFEGDCTSGRDQDAHVAAALGTGFRAERDGDRLTVTSEKGGFGLVYRAR